MKKVKSLFEAILFIAAIFALWFIAKIIFIADAIKTFFVGEKARGTTLQNTGLRVVYPETPPNDFNEWQKILKHNN